MLSFPNSKINIGLNIIGKRNDGYHNIETVFYPIAVKDALEIIESPTHDETDIIFTSSGNLISGNTDENLCVKAYRLLKKDFPEIPSVKMHLHKNIPMGAGLGGGSSDGAAVLLLLNKKFNLNISEEKLIQYALMLGSDCPFFLNNKPCFAEGRGEILKEIPLDLSDYKKMIVHPGIHVNTAEAFAHLAPGDYSPAGTLEKAIQKDITEWKTSIKNDFEKPVFKKYPEIENIKLIMYENGALYSAMSGSGSSVFGVFPHDTNINIKFPLHYFCRIV